MLSFIIEIKKNKTAYVMIDQTHNIFSVWEILDEKFNLYENNPTAITGLRRASRNSLKPSNTYYSLSTYWNFNEIEYKYLNTIQIEKNFMRFEYIRNETNYSYN